MIASGYSLDLYCDNDAPVVYRPREPGPGEHAPGEFPHQFSHERGSVCRRRARLLGWIFTRDGRHYCPRCAPLYRSGRLTA